MAGDTRGRTRRLPVRGNGDSGPGSSQPTCASVRDDPSTPPTTQQRLTRHPGDLVRAVLGATVVTVGAWAVRGGRVGPFETSLFRLVNRLPGVFEPALAVVMQAGTLAAVGVAAVVATLAGRRRLAADLLAGGGATWLAIKVIKTAVVRVRPGGLLAGVIVRGVEQTGLGYPSGHAAVAAALVTVAAPWLPRPWRRTAWGAVAVVAVARIYVGAHLPFDVIGGAAFGWMVGALVHLVRGAPGGEPSVALVTDALGLLRLHVIACVPLLSDARGSVPFTATTDDGRRWFVKVVGAEQRDADLLFKLYRFVIYRELEDEAPFATPKQQAEHEAYVALLAARCGARVPDTAGTVAAADGSGVLVQQLVDGSGADTLTDDTLTDDVLTAMWRQVAILHDHRIAHRDLRLANWIIGDDGHASIIDFGYAESGASDHRLAQDVAELLVATSATVGPERAVAAASDMIGPDALDASGPLLQPMALSSVTRRAARTGHLLDHVRAYVAEATGGTLRTLPTVTRFRVRPRVLIMLAALAFAIHLLLPQVGDLQRTAVVLRGARWDWVAAAAMLAAARYVPSAVALMGATTTPLALGRATLVQLAGSAAGKLAPGGLAGLGVNEQYLERSGAPRAAAVAAVGLDTLAGFIAHVVLLGAAVAVTGRRLPQQIQLPRGAILLGVLAAGAVAAGLALRLSWTRRHVVRPAVNALRDLRAVVRDPLRTLALFGGSMGLTLTFIACLYTSTRAFTPAVGVGSVALAYLVGMAIGSAAPTPGGLGVAEAALVTGLVGVGVPTAPAIAGVLLFRLLTFWLPTAPGAIALQRLRAAGTI